MQQMVPRLSDAIDAIRAERVRGHVPRDAVRAVAREHGRGLVVAARLDAGAHAARAGLTNVGMLSRDEELLIQFAPLGEARYKAIVDAYAIYAASEVSRL